MSLKSEVSRALSLNPEKFLIELSVNLRVSARSWYIEAGASSEDSVRALTGLNEIGIVVASQLRSVFYEDAAYPYEAFFRALNEKAERCNCEADLEWAMKYALERIQ